MSNELILVLAFFGHTISGFLILSIRDYVNGEDLTVEAAFKNLSLGMVIGIGAILFWLSSMGWGARH